jgi:hypothetical protein
MFDKSSKSLVTFIFVVLVLLAEAFVSSSASQSLLTVPITIISQVDTSVNDAEENLKSGNVSLTSLDLQLGEDKNVNQLVGIRFSEITIPHGATITSAYVEFEVGGINSTSTSVTIQGQAIDNAPVFASTKNNISARQRTTAKISWNNIPAWLTLNAKWQTPNISAIIQDIVSRPNWAVGNSIVIIIAGSGQRAAKSYDGEPLAAPKLIINYTIPLPSATPTSFASPTRTPPATSTTLPTPLPFGAIRFAVIGDYGSAGQPELDVANLVKSWHPDFIITTGDNNYQNGAANTIDNNIGQYYHEFIYPYNGLYGSGATVNRFFSSLGNHDWVAPNAQPYLNYFNLPGNERYYDFVWGPVHFFVIDSDSNEPDGISSSSFQAHWLQTQLVASASPWKLVYMHHPPYSSGANHGSTLSLQWPFLEWGADAVIAGHDHIYERILHNGFPYFVNGLGGSSVYAFGTPVLGSQVRYNADYGAMLVEANEMQIVFQFIARTGVVVDRYIVNKPATPTSTPIAEPTITSTTSNVHTPTNTPTLTLTGTFTPTFASTVVISTLPSDLTPVLFPKVLSIVRTNPNPTGAASVDFTVNFNQPVSGVDSTDFALITSGIAAPSITEMSGSGTTYTVTVNTGFGKGYLRLDLVDDDSIKDTANNPLGGTGTRNGDYINGQTYTIIKGGDTTGIFRPSNGLLYLKNANTTGFADIAINYGTAGDYPVAGDWDGNGTATIGIYRNGSFYLRNSNTLGFADLVFTFGQLGDQPVAGDWNGDGIDTVGVYRPSTGQFLLRNSNTSGIPELSFYLGNLGDVGIAGDWDGDGIDTTGVFRPSNGVIFLKNTNNTGFADVALNYGLAGDQPATGDWNGDGQDTIGVYRNGQFLLRNSNTNGFAEIVFGLGLPGDMPIAGDWDGKP